MVRYTVWEARGGRAAIVFDSDHPRFAFPSFPDDVWEIVRLRREAKLLYKQARYAMQNRNYGYADEMRAQAAYHYGLAMRKMRLRDADQLYS